MATFWVTELPGGGFAMGEAADETEARSMIESQQRGSVAFDEGNGRYRRTDVLDDAGSRPSARHPRT